MRRSKPGLADLRKLREQAAQPEPAPAPARPRRAARKRSPFLPPSGPRSDAAGPRAGSGEHGRAQPRGTDTAPGERQTATETADAATRLSEEDRKLFRSAVRYVEKLKDPGRALLAPVATAPASILKERRMRAAGLQTPKPGKRPSSAGDTAGTAPEARKPRPLSDAYAPAASDQDDSRYLKAGHGTDVLRDLKRGKWPIGASLDLHGSTLEDARERFERFLTSCLTHDVKCVRIVHGKGHGSPNGDAVLKATVRRWLTQIAEVIAYTECAEADGGSGAVQVLLK